MSEKTELALEVAGASIANKTTLVGAGAGAFSFLVDINWIGLIGVVIAVLGYLTNVYFQARRERLEQADRDARAKGEEIERNARMARDDAESAARIEMYKRGIAVGE